MCSLYSSQIVLLLNNCSLYKCTTELITRKALPEDVPALQDIAESVWKTSLNFNDEINDTGTIFLVVEEQNTHEFGLKAYAIMKISAWNNTGILLEFAVRKEFRRRGIGRSLIEELRKKAHEKGIRAILIETQPGNLEANEFYNSLGLRICGYNDRYYTNRPETPRDIAIFYSIDII